VSGSGGRARELVVGGVVADTPARRRVFRKQLRALGLDGHPLGGYEWALTGPRAALRRWLEGAVADPRGEGRAEVEEHLRRAVPVGGGPRTKRRRT
jgi:hypothetical protein